MQRYQYDEKRRILQDPCHSYLTYHTCSNVDILNIQNRVVISYWPFYHMSIFGIYFLDFLSFLKHKHSLFFTTFFLTEPV